MPEIVPRSISSVLATDGQNLVLRDLVILLLYLTALVDVFRCPILLLLLIDCLLHLLQHSWKGAVNKDVRCKV